MLIRMFSQLSVILSVVLSTPVNYSYDNPKILLSLNDFGICSTDIHDDYELNQNLNLIYNCSSNIMSIHYGYNGKSIVFQENDAIKRVNFDPHYDTIIEIGGVEVIIGSGVSKFTYDWISDLIYYKVRNIRQIIVVNVTDPTKSKVIINDTKQSVGDIKVDPINCLIFYTQWDDDDGMAQLISANQDGTNRNNILENVHLEEPTSLAIDFVRQTIYLIDTKLFQLASIDYKGNYRIIIKDRRDLFQYTRSIDIYKNQILWNFWKKVYYIPINGNERTLKCAIISDHDIDSVKVYDLSRQTYALNNQCHNNYCSYLCIPSAQRKYTCVCPQSFNMTPDSLCKESTYQMFDYTKTNSLSISTDSTLNEEMVFFDSQRLSSELTSIISISFFVIAVLVLILYLFSRRFSGRCDFNQNPAHTEEQERFETHEEATY